MEEEIKVIRQFKKPLTHVLCSGLNRFSSGYWQVPVTEQDRKKTVFTTPFGLHGFKTKPFGLQGAGATFERIIN